MWTHSKSYGSLNTKFVIIRIILLFLPLSVFIFGNIIISIWGGCKESVMQFKFKLKSQILTIAQFQYVIAKL